MQHLTSPRQKKQPLIRLLLIMAVLMTPARVLADSDDNAVRLEQVNNDVKELRALLATIRKERSTIEARLESTEKEINRVQKNLRATEAELRKIRQAEQKQQADRKALKDKKSRHQQTVSQVVKAAYTAGRDPQLKLILNQQNPARTSRMLAYYDRFAQTQSDALSALKESNRKLVAMEQQLARTQQQISNRRQQLTDQEQDLKANHQSRLHTLATLNNSETSNNSRLSRLQKEQQELQQILASIISIADITEVDRPFRQNRGKMKWPVKGPVLHRFGERRQNTKMTWNGMYIKASAGTAVTAPHHGRVVFSDWMKSFGQLLIVDHGKGYMTLYAHNQTLLKTEGDWVLPGEKIALVGNSGGQSQSGLYFEVRYKGRPSNPASWLVASR